MIKVKTEVNKIKPSHNLLIIFSIITFALVCFVYYKEIGKEGAGVDILWRVTESKYYLKGINPFDVFSGNKAVEVNLGMPAAYAFASYLINIPFAILNDNYKILIFYSIIDIFCLYTGLKLIRQKLGIKYSIADPIIIIITLFSLLNLGHIECLNYGIVSVFGLILAIYSVYEKKIALLIIGIILISLKPSLLIPFLVSCLILKKINIFALTVIINIGILIFSGWILDESIINLIKQLQETQMYFSRKGFYRWEGIFLILKNWFPVKMTILGIVASVIYIGFYKNKIENNFINELIIITTTSLAFFYNQEHAWAMVYFGMGYCVYKIKDNKILVYPLILIIIFMWIPSQYEVIEKLGFIKYMHYHNLIRFVILIIATGLIIKLDRPSNS